MSTTLNFRSGGGSRTRRGLVAAATAALVVSPLAAIAPASANPAGTGLVISEVYGSANVAPASYGNDFIEIHNPTGADVNVDGWSVQYHSATGTGQFAVTALSGVVAAGGHYLVQEGNFATGTQLPTPDATGTIALSGTSGVVALVSNTTPYPTFGTTTGVDLAGVTASGLVDVVGYGTTANTYETARTGAAPSNITSVQRSGDTDSNAADFTLATPTPTAGEAVDGPVIDTVADRAFTVDEAISPFTLTATGGAAPYVWSSTALPAGLTLDPATGEIAGTPTAVGVTEVTATVTDADDATDQDTFDISISAAATLVPIADIQGTGTTSPVAGQNVKTQGVVTAAYPTGGLNGFYLQTPGADTADASDAIFVYGGVSGFTTYPAVGDSVEVSGQAAEFSGATQIVANDAGVVQVAALGTVTPKTLVPGTDCALPGTDCLAGAALDTAREVAEGELFQPTAPWTATDVYDGGPYYSDGTNSSAFRGEIGVAANSDVPLVAPTEVIDAQATVLVAERKKYNDAHRIILDDASTLTYSTSQNSSSPFPWFTADHTVRVGAGITFTQPVIFTFGFNAWRILPQSQVVGAPTGKLAFEQTRPAAPEDVGGDIKLATFNVLNFFPTTGEEFVTSGLGTCTYFNDREGNPISNNSCSPNGPRGAANQANLVRQRDKIVAAINTVDADIVSLEELENSVKFNKARDFAINELVTALNADAGAGTWAAVPSAAVLPPTSEQDVIRNGFIYKPANVAMVGESVVLSDQSSAGEAFEDAREPVAQAFKRVGTPDASAFAVIVNHFKSKGSGNPDPDGQGNANERRVIQANALVGFADSFKTARGISRVFLAGDFNAYSEEDPIQVLNAAGYANLESTSNPEEESYNFDGMIGSLDHVLANAPAEADVNAVDIWEINGYESVYYEYARFNTNVTNLYAANPYRSSDHNPEVVGINTAEPVPVETEIQILGTNDFHGRLLNNSNNEAGAAVFAGAVKQLRATNPNTVFAAAGDLIGASTFESFIQRDKPTIDALNEAGLDVSAVGNHEFDAGYDDLLKRVMAPESEDNPLGGAEWEYIGANVHKVGAPPEEILDPTYVQDFGNGVEVGFIGAVTEDLPSLVNPDGMDGVTVEDIVTATNREANNLEAAGVDVIVLLVHEGASTVGLDSATDPTTAFGEIVNGVNGKVDAIVSGHTHLAYNHSIPVQAWIDEGRAVTTRPVVSAGQYGSFLNQLNFTVETATGDVLDKAQNIVALESCSAGTACGGTGQPAWTPNFPVDAATKAIVDKAVTDAAPLGAVELGRIANPFNRAKLANGTTENRGGESTLGNLVAEVQRWATESPEAGSAQIAFMNPGGLRADMVGVTGDFPRTLTYRQAADVQPFANTLVNMRLTGAQIKAALEQQWQPAGAARPFLRLGSSTGFTHTYDASKPAGSRITGMWLDGDAIEMGTSYSVTVNSFLAAGGDNFPAFALGAQKRDTGKVDLQGMVDYMAEFANATEGDAPLAPDFTQHSVGVVLPDGSEFQTGDTVRVNLSSLALSTAADLKDTEVEVLLEGESLGTFPVDNTIGTAVFDDYGTAAIEVILPGSAGVGSKSLRIVGGTTGTTVSVPITIAKGAATVSATASPTTLKVRKDSTTVTVTVSRSGGTPTGTVEAVVDGQTVGTGVLTGGMTSIVIGPFDSVGTKTITLLYLGDDLTEAGSGSTTVTVQKAKPKG